MNRPIALAILLTVLAGSLTLPAIAADLGARVQRPAKPPVDGAPPPPDPAVIRQGGDTIEDAVFISAIYQEYTGTTVGYTNDYDEVCPYTGSTAPDVVYEVNFEHGLVCDIDLYGSTYDTKVYVYNELLELVACNDDFYPDYVSKIEGFHFEAGMTYYIVIDGYYNAAGDYVLRLNEYLGPWFECPTIAELEGEPPLEDGYVDDYNGGCNAWDAPGGPPFQRITSNVFCGVTGWYDVGNLTYRDTDWFLVELPPGGMLTIDAQAIFETLLFELGPHDCATVGVLQEQVFGNDMGGQMIVTGEPGTDVWLWVGPDWDYDPVPNWEYGLFIEGIVSVQERTWTSIKGLFD
jgi:hypothetical protein